jgi:hypothetical protein
MELRAAHLPTTSLQLSAGDLFLRARRIPPCLSFPLPNGWHCAQPYDQTLQCGNNSRSHKHTHARADTLAPSVLSRSDCQCAAFGQSAWRPLSKPNAAIAVISTEPIEPTEPTAAANRRAVWRLRRPAAPTVASAGHRDAGMRDCGPQ